MLNTTTFLKVFFLEEELYVYVSSLCFLKLPAKKRFVSFTLYVTLGSVKRQDGEEVYASLCHSNWGT